MVALAAGPLEAAALALLRLLGVTALGGAVADEALQQAQRAQAREKQEAAERARALPIACAGVHDNTRRKCEPCQADRGLPYRRSFPERKPWVDYQARVGGMPNGPGFIVEWAFNGVVFDGFDAEQCMLKEAKGQYDQFFDALGMVHEWWKHNVGTLIEEMAAQRVAATPRPPIRLEWFWQQPHSYRYFSTVLSRVAPDVPHHYHP